jgi:hypothetical protein
MTTYENPRSVGVSHDRFTLIPAANARVIVDAVE